MKYTIIILFKETYKANQLAFILLDRLIRNYSIPKLIISNIALSQKIMSLASQLVLRYQQAAAKSGSVSYIDCGLRNQPNQQLEVADSSICNLKLLHWAPTTSASKVAFVDQRNHYTVILEYEIYTLSQYIDNISRWEVIRVG